MQNNVIRNRKFTGRDMEEKGFQLQPTETVKYTPHKSVYCVGAAVGRASI